jgi:hypothetical protein
VSRSVIEAGFQYRAPDASRGIAVEVPATLWFIAPTPGSTCPDWALAGMPEKNNTNVTKTGKYLPQNLNFFI